MSARSNNEKQQTSNTNNKTLLDEEPAEQHESQVLSLSQNDNDDHHQQQEQQEQQEDEENDSGVPVESLEAKDKVLYNEVLSYLMKGHKMTADGGDGGSFVNHMPRSVEKALSNRHVKVNEEPTDIIAGPVQFVDLPLGLALLFDVATDELFTERWQDRLLDEFPPPEKLDINKENEKAAAAAAAKSGESPSSGNDGSKKSGGDNGENKKDSADGEDDKGKEAESKKKEDDDNDDDNNDEENDDDGEGRSPSSKKKRIVEKPEWGGPKVKKPPPPKKYSTLVKYIPPTRSVEYVYTSDINAELQLVGAPEWIPYMSYLVSLPAPRDDRCTQLYEYGTNLAHEIERKVQEAKEEKAKQELESCTFKPTVSESAQRLPGWKGDMEQFYKDKLDWVKQMNRKLQKQKAKREKEKEELFEKWKMGEKSKKILERRERRLQNMGLEAGETPPRAADRRGVEVTPDHKNNNNNHNNRSMATADVKHSTYRKSVAAPEYSFKPVTNSNRHRTINQAKAALERSSIDENGNEKHYDFTAILDEFRLNDDLAAAGEDDERDFLSRMDDDYAGREERRKQRAIQFARQQKEKLFDPVTGQPLFEPNSAPTIVRQDGARVSFHDLSGKEKKDLIRKLKLQKRLDFIPGVARDKSGSQKMGEDEMAEMYKRMLEKVRQGTVRIDRIKRKEDQERKKWFRPTIEPKSSSILKTSGKMRKPVYRMPLPRKPSPPPPKPQPKSVATKMASVVERNDGFLNTKKDALERKIEEQRNKEKTFTYTPQVSKTSTRLVNQRRNLIMSEISQIEEQRRDFYAHRSAEIHYASDMAGGGPLRANNILHQHSSHSPSNQQQQQSAGAPRSISPKNQFASLSPHTSPSMHQDPVVDAFNVAREQGWNRPDARRPASHYYTDPPRVMTLERQQDLQRKQLAQQRYYLTHGGRFAEDEEHQQQQHQNHIMMQQTQYNQQQQNNNDNNTSGVAGASGDDIDSIVGSLLSNSARRRGGQQPQQNTSSVASPQPQQQTHQPEQQQPGASYSQPQFKPTSSASNSQPISSASPSRNLVGGAAADDESGSGRRLKHILASWDELEKQTASVL